MNNRNKANVKHRHTTSRSVRNLIQNLVHNVCRIAREYIIIYLPKPRGSGVHYPACRPRKSSTLCPASSLWLSFLSAPCPLLLPLRLPPRLHRSRSCPLDWCFSSCCCLLWSARCCVSLPCDTLPRLLPPNRLFFWYCCSMVAGNFSTWILGTVSISSVPSTLQRFFPTLQQYKN